MKTELWEILVPTTFEDTGKPVRTKHHKEWDKFVRKISGGLTIMHVVKGQWIDNDTLYSDRMIPVRVLCSKKDIDRIVDFTLGHYRQIAVLAYKISDTVILKRTNNAIVNKHS